MPVNLSGRVALITGSGSGLGREHALLFAKLGAAVIVNDLGSSVNGGGSSSAAADQVVAEIVAGGGDAVANYDSVADPAGAKRMVELAVERYGRLDILVNNAGILRDRSFAKMTASDFEEVIKVHLLGAFYVTSAAWPKMVAQEYGRVVMTTSAAGINGNFGQSNYGAAKLGLVGMMNCLALEGKRYNVLVNAISPGALTRMTEAVAPGGIATYLRADLVSPAVAWLCSERCRESGIILSAMAGFYSRVAAFEGAGVQFDPVEPVTVEAFDAAYDRIATLDGAKPVQPGPLGELEPRLKALGRL
jgi:NAD(P)-dependent dehydrogenase (short-subunit alcohol dehydrogenase family)